MSNSKISALTSATTPLAGTEVLPIVQSNTTKQVSVADLTAGRAVSAASLALTTTPLPATSGGTGQSSYAVGDLLYANTTTTLAKLADVATGNALISGGVGVAPSYGKIGLTTHVSGVLPFANGGIGTQTAANAILYTNGTPNAVSASTGFTFTGSVFTLSDASAQAYFTTTRNAGSEILRVETTGASYTGVMQYQRMGSSTGSTSNYYLAGQDSGGDRLYIYGNGDIKNKNGVYGTISDAKLKENVTDATPKLDDLMKLKVRNFNFIGSSEKQLGFIAQEFETVFPSMVDESNDIDENGEVTDVKTKGIKSSVLIPMLVKAMQEQQKSIQEQQKSIESLKDQINLLTSKG